VLVFHDITELRRLENIRKDFVANVSHELRTPLTSIKGYIEALLDGAKDDPGTSTRFLDIILKQSDRLNLILEDLLQLSKIESGQLYLLHEELHFREIMEQLADMIREIGPLSADEVAQRAVVAQHQRNLDRQLAGALAEQEVVHAVSSRRREHEGAKRTPDHVDDGDHVVALHDRGERALQLGPVGGRFHLQAHEEAAGVGAGELLALRDVAACLHDGAADRVHDSGLVGADQRDHPMVVCNRRMRTVHAPRLAASGAGPSVG